MKVGRELDALIAEKVMGELGKLRQSEHNLMLPHDVLLPYYSTQIADAWLVVEKFENPKRALMLGRHTLSGKRRWVVDIFHGDKRCPHRGIADTAPLAICLAALKAVEGDIK